MNPVLSFVVRMMVSIPAAGMAGLLGFFAFDLSLPASAGLAVGGGLLTYGISSAYLQSRFLKKHGLSRKEYRYIRENLAEAKQKIFRLHKALLSARQLPSIGQRIELSRLTRKIYGLTKKEPKRFYLAERFYFSHLDSAVELSEKVAFLSALPKKNREMEQALAETKRTLEEMTGLIEEDLYEMLAYDLDELHVELDVARHSLQNKQKKNLSLPDERREIK